MKSFIIKEELAQAILDYLVARPYKEVAGLVAGLMSLEVKDENRQDKV